MGTSNTKVSAKSQSATEHTSQMHIILNMEDELVKELGCICAMETALMGANCRPRICFVKPADSFDAWMVSNTSFHMSTRMIFREKIVWQDKMNGASIGMIVIGDLEERTLMMGPIGECKKKRSPLCFLDGRSKI